MKQRPRDKHHQPDQRELMTLLRAQLPELRERYGVRTLAIFGSYVRGEARERSDLDLLVEFEQVPSLFKFIDLEQYLTQLVGVKVDLVMKDTLKPAIGHRILSQSVPV